LDISKERPDAKFLDLGKINADAIDVMLPEESLNRWRPGLCATEGGYVVASRANDPHATIVVFTVRDFDAGFGLVCVKLSK
jgi:hypothetical protein